jgi:PAS domain S-box-containing protein
MEMNAATIEWPAANQESVFRMLIEQLPQPIGLYVGRDMIIAVANNAMLHTLDKDASIIGQSFREAMPELEGQPFFQLLDDVYMSGIAYEAKSDKVLLNRNGKLQTFYYDFCYTPVKDSDGKVWAIINTGTDVTNLVLAKQEADAIEEHLALALNSAEVGIWDRSIINHTLIWDDRCKQLFGFAPNDNPQLDNMMDNVHPDDRERVDDEIKRVLLSPHNGICDVVFRTVGVLDSKLRWLHCKGRAYFNDNDIAERFSGTAVEVSIEMEARLEQQKLLTLVENSSDYMGITDLNGKKTYLNRAGRKLIGLDDDADISQHSIKEFYVDGDNEDSILPALLTSDAYHSHVFLKHTKTGEIIPCQASYVLINDPITGSPAGRGAALRDLRSELAARKALAESEKLFRDVTTAAPTALWVANENGDIVYTNQVWEHWTGQSLSQTLGKGWMESIVIEDRNVAVEKFRADFVKRRFHENSFRVQHINGQIRWLTCTGNPQYNADGVFTGFIGACVDMTDQKQLQQQKDNFIGIASHELKTPVTSIKAYGQVLQAMFHKNGDERAAGMLQKMDAQINRLTSLIGDLLDVTKINSGRLQFNNSEFDFNEMMHTLIDDLQHTTTRHIIVKRFNYNGTLFSDRDRIEQVLVNLISNAIKYSPHTATIIVETNLHNDTEIQVSVQDFGVGIPPEKQNRVFEQFYRVSGNLQHTFPGLGLGLYISSEIIKREGGRIWVNSEEGKGSTFYFALPAHNTVTKSEKQ